MLRPLLSVALAAAALAASAQDLSQPVSISLRATTLDKAIEQIASNSKVPMDINPMLAKEVVLVNVKEMPLKMLMDNLAEVVSGEWVTSGGQLRLTVNAAKRRQEERTELEAIAKAIKADIDAMVKPPAANTDPDMQAMMSAQYNHRAVAQILSSVDPYKLAAIQKGTRLVFSTNPTAMQLPMPANSGRALTDYIKAHNDAVKDRGSETIPDMPDFPEFARAMMERQSKPIGAVSKTNLILSKQSFTEMMSAKIVMYGAKGETLHTSDVMLGTSRFMMDMEDGKVDTGMDKPEKPTTNTPVEYSADAKEFAGAFPTFSMEGGMSYDIKMSPELKRKVFAPEMYDPLSFGITDEIYAVGKAANKGVIALLPDEGQSFIMSMMGRGQQRTVEQVQQQIKSGEWLTQVTTPEAILLKPAKPALARTLRVDRVDLSRLMRAADSKGVPSLADVVAYAKGNPEPAESGAIGIYLTHLVPGVMSSGMQGETSWEAYRMFGGLNPLALTNLKNGQSLSLRTLPQPPMQDILFGQDARLTVGAKKDDDPFDIMRYMGSSDEDYRSEPTEAMPNGIPGQGTVTLAYSEENFAMTMGNSGTPSAQLGVLGSMELATLKYFTSDPQFQQFSAMIPKLDKFKVGTRKVYEFTFTVAPGVTATARLMDHSIDRTAATVGPNGFPAAFTKQIDEYVEKIKKSPMSQLGGMMGGMGGGRIKP